MHILDMFESVKRDIRDSIRSLGRRPGFTAVAVLSLAVGIGANTAIFSLVNAIILRDTPIERPEELVNIYLDQAAFQYSSLSYPDFEDLRDGTNDVFSGIAAAQFVPVQVDSETGSGGCASSWPRRSPAATSPSLGSRQSSGECWSRATTSHLVGTRSSCSTMATGRAGSVPTPM